MTEIERYIPVRINCTLSLLILLLTVSLPVRGQSEEGKAVANVLSSLNIDTLGDFAWMNEPEEYVLSQGTLAITADKGTDFFINPEDETSVATAPFIYREIGGDFVAVAKVKPDFSYVWNACALMVHIDEDNWIKFAFENSDATGPSVVSVVTRSISDDANGAILNNQKTLWLKLIRKGKIYAMHWSTDGENYKLARLAAMPNQGTVKVGIEAQCPAEGPAVHLVSYFSLEKQTVGDLRKGL